MVSKGASKRRLRATRTDQRAEQVHQAVQVSIRLRLPHLLCPQPVTATVLAIASLMASFSSETSKECIEWAGDGIELPLGALREIGRLGQDVESVEPQQLWRFVVRTPDDRQEASGQGVR